MDSGWEPPGYEALELLGFGSVGEVWRSRVLASGELVALRRLQGVSRDDLQVLRRHAALVRSLPTDHVVGLRAVHGDVLVLEHAPGGSLASLLALRGRLEPGEVVTVVAPVAQALAQGHAAGLVHGHVGATSVLLTADGMPLLDELGAGHLRERALGLDPSGVLGAAADVWALGALCHELLTGAAPGPGNDPATPAQPAPPATPPAALVKAVEAALAFDPARRPGAEELGAMLLAACPAVPVQFPAGTAPGPPPGRAGRPSARPELPPRSALRTPADGAVRRRLLTGSAVTAALGAVALAGWTWGSGGGTGGSAAATAVSVAAPDWAGVLAGLDRTRSRAYATGDPAALAAVYLPNSAVLRADGRQLRALAARRRTAQGVRHRVVSVRALEITTSTVRLRVVEGLQGGALLDEQGVVVELVAPTRPRAELVALRRTGAGWRVEQVRLAA